MSSNTPAPASPGEGSEGTDPASAAAPPSRAAALKRSALIIAVLFVVFVVILPRFVDYEDVVNAFLALTPPQVLLMTVLGAIAWVVAGLVFCAFIPGVSVRRGAVMYLILSGIGSSVPLGPWNMGVVWVVARGWGIPNRAATAGVALYGLISTLSRLAMPLLAVAIFALTGEITELDGPVYVITLISIVVFVVAIILIVAIIRSDRVADWLGRTGQRIASWVLRRLGRTGGPDVSRAIHRFRDQLGEVIQRRGLVGLLAAILVQVTWTILLIVALRVVGVPESALAPSEIFAVSALVAVITLIPIAPGGAGVPELLYIAGLSAIAGSQYESTITAGVFLYRLYNWFLPIPLAWILLKVVRPGKSVLPTTAEIKTLATSEAA